MPNSRPNCKHSLRLSRAVDVVLSEANSTTWDCIKSRLRRVEKEFVKEVGNNSASALETKRRIAGALLMAGVNKKCSFGTLKNVFLRLKKLGVTGRPLFASP